jgi:hypothetical protein
MRRLIAAAVVLLAGTVPALTTAEPGILVLAPTGTAEWSAHIKGITAKANAQKPTELVVGTPTHAAIEAAVDRLAKRGVTDVTAVPFFLPAAPDPQLATGYAVPVHFAASPASAPLFADIILSRAQEISRGPSEEMVLVAGYGADENGTPWAVNLAAAAQRLNRLRVFESVLTIKRPDLSTEAEQRQLRQMIERLSAGRRIVVVPVVTLPSAVSAKIDECLRGYSYEVTKSDVLSDARLVEWLISRTAQ